MSRVSEDALRAFWREFDAALAARGLAQDGREASRRAGFEENYVKGMRAKLSRPGADRLVALARVLDVDPTHWLALLDYPLTGMQPSGERDRDLSGHVALWEVGMKNGVIDRDVVSSLHWTVPGPVLEGITSARKGLRLVPLDNDTAAPLIPASARLLVDLDDQAVENPGIFLLNIDNGMRVMRVATIPGARSTKLHCVSINPHYASFDLPRSAVQVEGRVRGYLHAVMF